ncbi:MAG: response regulator [Alphaproteobacteria bacterium]|nr:response regulator [Alphaproteobacteria bacterium]
MARHALIVDDSLTMRNMVSIAMKKEGFEVELAKDGVEALEIAQRKKMDVIITDINMPNMDGIELIRMLRGSELARFTPILVLTTEDGDNVKQAGKQAGATGWIVKPFNPEILSRAVSKVCNSG